MKVAIRALFPAMVFMSGLCGGLASEPVAVDVKQEKFAEATDDIDHLEPVRGSVPEFYYIAQFIESPSFNKGTYLAVLRTERGKYLLQLTTIPPGKRPTERPSAEAELEIPEPLAEVIYQIWVNALLEVRYDRKSYRGFDGAGYTFSTFVRGAGWMHGSVWSPQADLPPRWLVDCAHEIVAFARDSHRDANKTQATLERTRDKLFEYLKKNGKH